MIMKRFFIALLLACVTLLLNSCLNGEEEFWFERDGSGRLEAEYQLPAFALATMGGEDELRATIEGFFAKEPGVTLDSFALEKRGAQVVMTIRARFTSVMELSSLLKNSGAGGEDALPGPMVELLGKIKVARQGMSVDFQRRIDPKGIFGGGLLAPGEKQLAGYHLQYTMHLPTKAETSNAHEVRDDGQTLVWRYALADAMKAPVETNFVTPIPIPWWAYLVVAVVVIFSAWLLRFVFRMVRPKLQPKSIG